VACERTNNERLEEIYIDMSRRNHPGLVFHFTEIENFQQFQDTTDKDISYRARTDLLHTFYIFTEKVMPDIKCSTLAFQK